MRVEADDMNWNTIEKIAKSMSTPQDGKPQTQFYFKLCELARMMGVDQGLAREFLIEHSVPHYRIGKTKSYLLPEVQDAIDKTRWK